jgi:hypothetical protein
MDVWSPGKAMDVWSQVRAPEFVNHTGVHGERERKRFYALASPSVSTSGWKTPTAPRWIASISWTFRT